MTKGVVIQRRLILLFVLFLVLTLFYRVVIRQNMAGIEALQKAQTEALNNLDERALSQLQSGN